MTHHTVRDEELDHAAGLLRTALEILDRTGATVAALHVATAVAVLSGKGPNAPSRQRASGL